MRVSPMATFWSRVFRAPENDEGSSYEEENAGGDEVEDDADEGYEDEVQEPADGDEGQDDVGEDESEGDEEERPRQVATKSRGANRVAEATRIAKEAKERADAAERRLAEIERGQQQRQQQETQQQRNERLALMDPEQRTQYLLQEQEQRFQSQLNAIKFEAQDSADRTAFEGLCARNPVANKHKDLVDQELQRLRATGHTAPRETILNYVVGRAALAATPRSKARAERDAAANRTRQTARPGSGRSDVAASGGRGSEAQQRAKRLENMEI